ncbi:MAG: TIGR01440 family protein [Clostridia bacterium]|nr:TIGR01440 family protein [Clostridia bacterium]
MSTYDEIREQAKAALGELLEKSHLEAGDIFIIGCSSSEIKGVNIGRGSDVDAAKAVYEGVKPLLDERGIFLAAQCCEHLNRAVIIERKALLPGQDIVNVVPQLHAGGSFAMTVYNNAEDPVAVENVRAAGGMDIGDTLIGMHLKPVAVPVRLSIKEIGCAHLVCARTRPKFVGGERAVYDKHLSGGDIPR